VEHGMGTESGVPLTMGCRTIVGRVDLSFYISFHRKIKFDETVF
jgi:hypothetical protein